MDGTAARDEAVESSFVSSVPSTESQRIYWQQWMTVTVPTNKSMSTSTTKQNHQHEQSQPQRRKQQLITSSAAVRIDRRAAKACDVTDLLRKTLQLDGHPSNNGGGDKDTDTDEHDSLVLVGTIHNLPADYVQFEHEILYPDITDAAAAADDTSPVTFPSPSPSSEPFHVVQTLQPNDSPLQKRDEFVRSIQTNLIDPIYSTGTGSSSSSSTTTTISTQFFFVPTGDRTDIPACIDLEGYMTELGNSDIENYDEDDDTVDDTTEEEEQEQDTSDASNEYEYEFQFEFNTIRRQLQERSPRHRLQKKKKKDDTDDPQSPSRLRRYLQISQSHASPSCLSGFVLKQSTRDKHVWKRVYCVLSDDYLWFVPRLPNRYQRTNNNNIRMASRHRRIELNRALLIESVHVQDTIGSQHNSQRTSSSSSSSSSSMYRVPNSWQIVTGTGSTHTFRSTSSSVAYQWVTSIRQRLVECYEQSLLQSAEMLLTDEIHARNHRTRSTAIDPLLSKWENQQQTQQQEQNHQHEHQQLHVRSSFLSSSSCGDLPTIVRRLTIQSKGDFQSRVVRFAIHVSSYKEQWKHLQSLLLTQVSSSTSGSQRLPSSVGSGTIDHTIIALSTELWDHASDLLGIAKELSSQVKVIGPTTASGAAAETAAPNRTRTGSVTTLSSMTSLTSVASSSTGALDDEKDGTASESYADNAAANASSTDQFTHVHSSRSLETLCRHLEYNITGEFVRTSHHRSQQGNNTTTADAAAATTTARTTAGADNNIKSKVAAVAHHRIRQRNNDDPPPMDVFDRLLDELMNVAVAI